MPWLRWRLHARFCRAHRECCGAGRSLPGVIADGDSFSALAGPAVYLAWYRTYTHSILAALVIAAASAVVYRWIASVDLRKKLSGGAVFAAMLLAALLHVAMDAAQWQGVELFWPFNGARIAADWLPTIDPWILVILVAAIVLPELLHLVNSGDWRERQEDARFCTCNHRAGVAAALYRVACGIACYGRCAIAKSGVRRRVAQANRSIFRLYIAGYMARSFGDGKRAS